MGHLGVSNVSKIYLSQSVNLLILDGIRISIRKLKISICVTTHPQISKSQVVWSQIDLKKLFFHLEYFCQLFILFILEKSTDFAC